MSEAKFSSGPWKKSANSAGSIEVEFDCGPLKGNEYLSIGIATEDSETTRGPRTEAIANLIAAAPEMYEILIQLQIGGGLGIARHRQIEKLLAKARGEQ